MKNISEKKGRLRDIDKVMEIWLKSTIKAYDFIAKQYWENNYKTVKAVYISIAESFVYEDVATSRDNSLSE